ncbi:UDP-N-acetylmuramoyl-L-alanine--D-glutamate ligase [Candidatus Saccharibacteria bacterium]|nr:UDP-N-acetylmuramoyl-L-alanine--D-glutamate ligase [Candidatus Saccharibacteria bacterium]
MKIALLGHGKEGQAVEKCLKQHHKNVECDIFENFTYDEIKSKDFSEYDFVFRSPSVPPLHLKNETSVTKYFFDHCPCKIIGVTGTKGKGTTCSFIKAILDAMGQKAYLVGNIGKPSIDILDDLQASDVVVYEMSSFQLWDLQKSPQTAVVLRIEPDHLNVHKDFDDYVDAKSHIASFQSKDDNLIYFKDNPSSVKIADKSPAKKFPYPLDNPSEQLKKLLGSLQVPGKHNQENAEAALITCSAFLGIPLEEFIAQNYTKLESALQSFKGLPHHLEFVRTLNDVDYYDDSFSASSPSLEVAIKAFPNQKVILIAGGKDRGLDLKPHKQAIFTASNLEKALLIGETRFNLSADENSEKYLLFENFEDAVTTAKTIAEDLAKTEKAHPVVLLSPGAASFDMFKDFYERGDKFQQIVRSFK